MTDSTVTPSPYHRLFSLLPLITSAISIAAMVTGGIIVISRIQEASAQIPSLTSLQNSQTLEIAILKEQQRDLDRKYGEIMLQLSRLDAKLDKQNEYLFNSLERLSRNQKNSN